MNSLSLLDYVEEEELPEWFSDEYFVVCEDDWTSHKQKAILKVKRKPFLKGLRFVLEKSFSQEDNEVFFDFNSQVFKTEKEAVERFNEEKRIIEHFVKHKGLAFGGRRYWFTHYEGKLLNAVIFIDNGKYVYLRKK